MPLIPPAPSKTQRELVPEGNHPARIYELIEIGTVEGSWMGQPKMNHNVRVSFEFPTKKFVFNEEKGAQPFVLSREMSLSLGEKANLRKIVEAVEGRKLTDAEAVNYDVLTIVGKPLLVTVSHTEPNQEGIQYANATTFSAVIEGLTVAPLYNPIRVLTYGEWNSETFNSLPDFLKEKMVKTPEYQQMTEKKFEVPTIKIDVKVDDGSVKNVDDIPF
jgi:hypothetical protein